jgi:hypothetical protein
MSKASRLNDGIYKWIADKFIDNGVRISELIELTAKEAKYL